MLLEFSISQYADPCAALPRDRRVLMSRLSAGLDQNVSVKRVSRMSSSLDRSLIICPPVSPFSPTFQPSGTVGVTAGPNLPDEAMFPAVWITLHSLNVRRATQDTRKTLCLELKYVSNIVPPMGREIFNLTKNNIIIHIVDIPLHRKLEARWTPGSANNRSSLRESLRS